MPSSNNPGKKTTADQVLQNADLTGKTVLVTGGNSGLGTETTRVLAGKGAKVIITSRKLAAGEQVVKELQRKEIKGPISVKQLDLADLKSVQALAADINATEPHLDLLILNAGVMASPKSYTKQDFEIQIGTNHFGHFLLCELLLAKMTAQSFPSRIIVLTSLGHKWGPPEGIDFDDMHWRKKPYKTWKAYGQSKLANLLHVRELAQSLDLLNFLLCTQQLSSWPAADVSYRLDGFINASQHNKAVPLGMTADVRLQGTNVTAYAVHPGVILTTGLTRHAAPTWIPGAMWISAKLVPNTKTIPQGAATTVWAAVTPGMEQHSGAYLEDCSVSQSSKHGQDLELARKLWLSTEEQIAAALSRPC